MASSTLAVALDVPWPYFGQVTDDDRKTLWIYLQLLPILSKDTFVDRWMMNESIIFHGDLIGKEIRDQERGIRLGQQKKLTHRRVSRPLMPITPVMFIPA
jgi:hypothetical protein